MFIMVKTIEELRNHPGVIALSKMKSEELSGMSPFAQAAAEVARELMSGVPK